MVQNFEHHKWDKHIRADIIVLGCSLPGIVTAHKLKKKFGNTMEIVILDLANTPKADTKSSKANVAFKETEDDIKEYVYEYTARDLIDNVATFYLNMYAKEFSLPLPDAIMCPEKIQKGRNKIFEYKNGDVVKYISNLHNFDYLNILERFELNQYQKYLEHSMKDLFQANKLNDDLERRRLLYYDQTTIENHICHSLLFPNSREIMRNTVRLVCGVSSKDVSLLFYLHQCYRTSSTRNHLDGNNTRLREKLFGYCRKHLSSKLQKGVTNIRLSAKSIKEISLYSGEKVILKTITGDTNYICKLLAMALKPDELSNIQFESQLLSEREASIFSAMKKGTAKKFIIQYEDHFWRDDGYSGDIFSVKGPIVWATERPKLSSEGSEHYAALIGYLKTNENNEDSKDAVIEQLLRLFGANAANPVSYKEKEIYDEYVPRCGDFIALRALVERPRPFILEWAALDVFADGDVAAALEAGHCAYLRLLRFLRPQAQTYEDLRVASWPTVYNQYGSITKWMTSLNLSSSARLVFYTTAAYLGFRLLQYLKK